MPINECPSCGRYPHLANCPHAQGMSVVGSFPPLSIHPLTPEGVWALCDRDFGETITAVYSTEVEALRAINGRGYGRVVFLPFGKTLNDMDNEEMKLAELRTQLGTPKPASADAGTEKP